MTDRKSDPVAAVALDSTAGVPSTPLTTPQLVWMFLAFAMTYFVSAVLRAITATLAPVFSSELALDAADLGLLGGAFFFGFAAVQLPLGWALDRYGPRRTLLTLLVCAVLGCVAFAQAQSLQALVAARALTGAGLGACLMAALTSYRRWYSPVSQLRANSWMLMSGSIGMVASTLPVQALLPMLGWRGLFGVTAGLLVLCMLLLRWLIPADQLRPPAASPVEHERGSASVGVPKAELSPGYLQIVRHPVFLSMGPLAFFTYGGLIAIQSLWAGPWLTRVSGWSAVQAAQGLFAINVGMLLAFMSWGALMPTLNSRGWSARRLMSFGLPLSIGLLAWIVYLGSAASALHWALWCVACTFVSISQPAVGASFAPAQAGRALSAFNLVIFGGVFAVQWGLGLLIDGLKAAGHTEVQAFRLAMAAFGLSCLLSYLWFLLHTARAADNGQTSPMQPRP